MNKQRTWFQLPPDSHKYLITPYWLLGFVEGEGSFSIHPRDLVLTFSITQSIIDLSLMEAIKYFLNNLPVFNPGTNSEQNSVKGKDKVGL